MPAGQTGVSEGALRDRAQTVPDSVSRHRRRVARPAGGSRDVPRGLGDDVEVLHGRPDVGRRDVPAAEPLDLTTVRAHQRVGLVSSSIPDDHCFAAPKRKIRAGGLVRHRLPETESVGQRFVLVRVRPHPRTRTKRWPTLSVSGDRKSTRLNSSHVEISYAVFCLKKKKKIYTAPARNK